MRSCAKLLALVLLAAPPALAAEPQPAGHVAELVGTAQVTRNPARSTQPLAEAAPVFQQDVIHTGAESRLRLEFIDDTVVMLGENTTLAITRFVYSPDTESRTSVLTTTLGFVRTVVQQLLPRSQFEVRTVTAVASVRSTDWIVESGPDATAIVVLDGEVAVGNLDTSVGGVTLGAGEGTVVLRGEPPTPPSAWGQGRINRAIQATRIP